MKVNSEFDPYQNMDHVELKNAIWCLCRKKYIPWCSIEKYEKRLKSGEYKGIDYDIISRGVRFWKNAPEVYCYRWLN